MRQNIEIAIAIVSLVDTMDDHIEIHVHALQQNLSSHIQGHLEQKTHQIRAKAQPV